MLPESQREPVLGQRQVPLLLERVLELGREPPQVQPVQALAQAQCIQLEAMAGWLSHLLI